MFAGWVSDTDSFYNAIDVNTLSSLSEAFPYALPEGARMHCATIATRVGGVPYIIENGVTGLLFEPRDVDTLTEHMKRLAENTAFRRQLAENLHARASEKLSVDATVNHQKEIYRTILRQQARPKQKRRGVLICGTGIGMALTADKVAGVLAAVIQSPLFAHLFREHNDGNVVCMSGRFTPFDVNKAIVDEFLTTEFGGGRHAGRVQKIMREDDPGFGGVEC